MTIESLIQSGAVDVRLDPAIVNQLCQALGVSPHDLFNEYAKQVADGFLAGRYSWVSADSAMNAFFAYWSTHSQAFNLPDFAFGVYLAFDAGELSQEPDVLTKSCLSNLLNQGPA